MEYLDQISSLAGEFGTVAERAGLRIHIEPPWVLSYALSGLLNLPNEFCLDHGVTPFTRPCLRCDK